MNEVLNIFKKVGALLVGGHFVGTSGLHFDTYVNKDFLYPHTKDTYAICKLLAEKYKDSDIEVVVGPALGGIILSQWVAYHLTEMTGREVLAIYTEKSKDGEQVFTRGYEKYINNSKRVLVVEDIITTGGSILKTIHSVNEAGGEVVGACALVNKNKNLDVKMFRVDFFALIDLYVDTYEASLCTLCQKGIPINTNVGHGKKYLASLVGLRPRE
jgi:orotate phosphoribosyltransferase